MLNGTAALRTMNPVSREFVLMDIRPYNGGIMTCVKKPRVKLRPNIVSIKLVGVISVRKASVIANSPNDENPNVMHGIMRRFSGEAVNMQRQIASIPISIDIIVFLPKISDSFPLIGPLNSPATCRRANRKFAWA